MSLKKLVDLDLLEEFLTNVKALIKPYSTAYGVCDTSGSIAAKTVNITGFVLEAGATVHVRFSNGNSAVNPTLNVNNTGAVSILGPDLKFASVAFVTLTYDGSFWRTSYAKNTYYSGSFSAITNTNGPALRYIRKDQNSVTQDTSVVQLTAGDNIQITQNSGNITFNSPGQILVFELASFSSLPQTVSDSLITANHELIRAELGTPSSQIGDWTVTTADGSVTVSGTISGSTTLKLILGIPANAT